MKRYLPLLLFLGGLLVLAGVYFFVIRKPAIENSGTEEETLLEVSLADRPVASLTPTADGHWLNLVIEKIKIAGQSLDYELLYTLADGRTQGVPGTIALKGESKIERKLLLGSESSGKFRYDEGVETGTLALRFRNAKGKLIAKFSTKFHLQSATKDLSSVDGKFSYMLDKLPAKTFFVTMETFGVPTNAPGTVTGGPYGVFSSGSGAFPGTAKLSGGVLYTLEGTSWTKLTGPKASDIGIFITTSE